MIMEVTATSIIITLVLVALLTCLWRVVNWIWLRPKQLEKCLREQGLRGNPYKLLYGDAKELMSMIKESQSKPMDKSSNDIMPRVLPFHQHFSKLHGKGYFIWMGTTPRVNVMDPKLIKEILFRNDIFQKPKLNPLGQLLQTGLLGHEGEKWAKHRTLLNPAFHLEKLKNMVPAMYSSCSEMINKWEELVSTTASCELDVWPDLTQLSGDVISRTAFGSNYEGGKRIFQLQREQSNLIIQLLHSVYIPGWRFLPTKTNKRIKEMHHEMGSLLRDIINKRERAIKDGEEGDNDLLGTLLKQNKEIHKQGNNKNVTMSTEEVVEECKLFYFAGQETTSILLVWTMVLLSKHQEWQALARAEVLTMFRDKKPDFNGLNHLKVVTMILHEALRLYPPGGAITRSTCKKEKLGDFVLPPGVELSVPIVALHHDRELWGEDAAEFKPERFSEGISKITDTQGTFLPFGNGPRVCIGQNFALLEAKLAIAMIVRHFSFQLSPAYVHAPTHALALIQPQHGAHLILQKV